MTVDLVVVEHHLTQTFFGIDGKAVVLKEAAVHSIIANEVRHDARSIRAEHVLRGLGGLEKDVAVAVAVQLACALTSETEVVTTLQEGSGNVNDRVGPVLLRGDRSTRVVRRNAITVAV